MRSAKTKEKGLNTYLGVNPLIKKLEKVDETATEGESASYGGIVVKTIYFLLMTVIGFTLYFLSAPYLATGEPIQVEQFTIYIPQSIAALAGLALAILMPILAWVIKPAIPVLGSVYCLSQGFLIGWLSHTFAGEYDDIIFLAVGITLCIVLVMLVLYASGLVKVNKKFRTVVTTLFITSILVSLLALILSFIPAASGFIDFIYGNSAFSIGFSIVFIIIAALFLLSDFNTIQQTVEKKLPKKYEWMASFGLAFTIIWLYLKVLDLLMSLKDN